MTRHLAGRLVWLVLALVALVLIAVDGPTWLGVATGWCGGVVSASVWSRQLLARGRSGNRQDAQDAADAAER